MMTIDVVTVIVTNKVHNHERPQGEQHDNMTTTMITTTTTTITSMIRMTRTGQFRK